MEQPMRDMGLKARLDVQQGLLHAQHGAVHVYQLAAEADKVGIVFIDDLHQAVSQRLQVRLQLRAQRFQGT